MAHFFVGQGQGEIPRWRMAFPDAHWVGPEQALARVGRDDRAWVMSNLTDWEALVRELAERGAMLVVLSYLPSMQEASQALSAGARGYTHALSPAALMRQVELVVTNQGIWVLPELMSWVAGSAFKALGGRPRNQAEDGLGALTERERVVALAVAEGQTNKEVARELDITERTVKAHLGAVFRKLGIRDRMQLVLHLSQREVDMADNGR
ncbi:response regulator transcription factor [Halomonas sp. MCCC 1A11036]|uniref:Response regulator transcription factor n=1 Tax=Billgrantia zhangzhouensis TaxID=2733481 RepID=A0ABS9AKC5_9GAMM|nr:response regulator transcription factor [Halomonas zhangzhouensis]MCE8022189.1 response regulator transcription factor [Halomonas zhangzhouensis]